MKPNDSSHLALELVRYRVLEKSYSKWRAIIAELGESDTAFLIALREVHGIAFDKAADPMLYVTQDTQQMKGFTDGGLNPTMLQILLTARVIALSEEEAKAKFERKLKEDL